MSEALTSARSLVRPLERKDIPALAQLTRANREFLAPTSPRRPEEHFTDEGQERAAPEGLQAAENGTALPLVIVDRVGNLVGTLNINSIIRGAFQSASIGYWVSEDCNGQGLGSAAVAAAKRIASDRLGLHRLQAETLVDNEASPQERFRPIRPSAGLPQDRRSVAGPLAVPGHLSRHRSAALTGNSSDARICHG